MTWPPRALTWPQRTWHFRRQRVADATSSLHLRGALAAALATALAAALAAAPAAALSAPPSPSRHPRHWGVRLTMRQAGVPESHCKTLGRPQGPLRCRPCGRAAMDLSEQDMQEQDCEELLRCAPAHRAAPAAAAAEVMSLILHTLSCARSFNETLRRDNELFESQL